MTWYLTILMVFMIIACGIAVAGMIAIHIKAYLKNKTLWKEDPDSNLYYAFAFGTGQYRKSNIYKDAREMLKDNKTCSISYLARKLREKEKGGAAVFFGRIAEGVIMFTSYIALFFRVTIGNIYLFISFIVHSIALLLFTFFSQIVKSVVRTADNNKTKKQHCPGCYAEFKIPKYICPNCETVHSNLTPGNNGIFYAKCKCGEMLPCTISKGRTQLSCICPNCEQDLATSGSKEITIQLVGGDKSGKTAFLAAFQHVYKELSEKGKELKVELFPKDLFDYLEDAYEDGITVPSSKTDIIDYNFINKWESNKEEKILIYDIPDEALTEEFFEKYPIALRHTKGIIFIIDPTSEDKVRKAITKSGDTVLQGTYSENDTEGVLLGFREKFFTMTNTNINKKSDIPIAVVINKCDISYIGNSCVYKGENGVTADPDFSKMSEKTRKFLMDNQFSNTVNMLEASFANVKYFAVSAKGHRLRNGKSFSPKGVIEPVYWLLKKSSKNTSDWLRPFTNDIAGKTE